MDKKTITLSNKAFEILYWLIGNELLDRASDITFENFKTPEEAEENVRAYREVFKAFDYDFNEHHDAVILQRPFGEYCYHADWKKNYEDSLYYDYYNKDKAVKEITL